MEYAGLAFGAASQVSLPHVWNISDTEIFGELNQPLKELVDDLSDLTAT